VERTVTVRVPLPKVYDYLWDVPASSRCMPGLASCTPVGNDTFCFLYRDWSAGPLSMRVHYTAKYEGNGVDEIRFESTGARGDNTEVSGLLRLQPSGIEATRIILRQLIAPDTPIPQLLQSLIRSFLEREVAQGVQVYLSNIKRDLEAVPGC
jgi:carbon monoxide dehydrogenase subunit G